MEQGPSVWHMTFVVVGSVDIVGTEYVVFLAVLPAETLADVAWSLSLLAIPVSLPKGRLPYPVTSGHWRYLPFEFVIDLPRWSLGYHCPQLHWQRHGTHVVPLFLPRTAGGLRTLQQNVLSGCATSSQHSLRLPTQCTLDYTTRFVVW